MCYNFNVEPRPSPRPSPKSPLSEAQVNQAKGEGPHQGGRYIKRLAALVDHEARIKHEETGELPDEPQRTIIIHGDQPSWRTTTVPIYGDDEHGINLKRGLRPRGKDDQFTR